jgi:uncharacterized membrane protein YbhN (UPF0104 family)
VTRESLRRALRTALRIVPLAAVVVLAVVYRDEVVSAARRLGSLHPVVFLTLPLYFAWNYLAGYSWRALLAAAAPGRTIPSAWRISILRLRSQAVNMATPFAGGVGGGALRIASTRDVGLAPAAAAAILDDIAGGVAGFGFVALALSGAKVTLFGFQAATLVAICAVCSIGLWATMVWLAPTLAAKFDPKKPFGNALRVLAENRARIAPAFAVAVFWHVVERAITSLEIWVAFMALGAPAGISEAVTVQAAIVAVSVLLFFIPGQPGAIEAAVATACAALGLDPATGLAVAFIRRARHLAVTGIGLASFSFARERTVAP